MCFVAMVDIHFHSRAWACCMRLILTRLEFDQPCTADLLFSLCALVQSLKNQIFPQVYSLNSGDADRRSIEHHVIVIRCTVTR